MRVINIISVLGLILSAYFTYNYFYLNGVAPRYYPDLVMSWTLLVFAASYLLSLFQAGTTFAKVFALTIIFSGFVGTVMYSILVMLSKTPYPAIFNISGAYIQASLFLLLFITWNKSNQ